MTLRGDGFPPNPVLGDVGINDAEDANKNRALGIVAYFGILFVIPLAAGKDSPFARYHANQGLVLFLFSIVVAIAMELPGIGRLIRPIGGLADLILMILGIVNAAQGLKKPLPLIGGITIIN